MSISTLPPPPQNPLRVMIIDANIDFARHMAQVFRVYEEDRFVVVETTDEIPLKPPVRRVELVIFNPDDLVSPEQAIRMIRDVFPEHPWIIAQSDRWEQPLFSTYLRGLGVYDGFQRGHFREMIRIAVECTKTRPERLSTIPPPPSTP